MNKPPVVLVSPNVEKKGDEFGDLSTSLSETYQRALLGAGAIPLALPATESRAAIAAAVRRCDGVLLTGGEDVDPRHYEPRMPAALRRKIHVTPDDGARDTREILLVKEVFRQRKPILAICRGHQVLNVALGGGLLADIPSQLPLSLNHRQMQRRSQIVHQVRLKKGSLLAKITGRLSLGVNSTHHQAVGFVAKPLEVIGTSPDGVIEAMELKRSCLKMVPFLLSLQFHPERLVSRHAAHRAIFRAFVAACRAEGQT